MSFEAQNTLTVYFTGNEVVLLTIAICLIHLSTILCIYIILIAVIEPILMLDYHNRNRFHQEVCRVCQSYIISREHQLRDIRCDGTVYCSRRCLTFSQAQKKVRSVMAVGLEREANNRGRRESSYMYEGTIADESETEGVELCHHLNSCLNCQQMIVDIAKHINLKLED